jgi:alkylhydroperoxidase/carboxymuconolactone decarboxylase family protein YurZ
LALQEHTRYALACGFSPDELYEVCFLLVFYCGIEAVREASALITAAVDEYTAATTRSAEEDA